MWLSRQGWPTNGTNGHEGWRWRSLAADQLPARPHPGSHGCPSIWKREGCEVARLPDSRDESGDAAGVIGVGGVPFPQQDFFAVCLGAKQSGEREAGEGGRPTPVPERPSGGEEHQRAIKGVPDPAVDPVLHELPVGERCRVGGPVRAEMPRAGDPEACTDGEHRGSHEPRGYGLRVSRKKPARGDDGGHQDELRHNPPAAPRRERIESSGRVAHEVVGKALGSGIAPRGWLRIWRHRRCHRGNRRPPPGQWNSTGAR